MRIQPFEGAQVVEAAVMAASAYADLRVQVPALPASWAEPSAYEPLLRELIEDGGGLAAVRGGVLVAFLGAWRVERRGERWIFSPEWGNGASGPDRGRLAAELYAEAARGWVDGGRRLHYVAHLANDEAMREAYLWLGFGYATADGVRSVDPIDGPPEPSGVSVRRADGRDVGVLVELEEGLRAHVAGSPVFFALGAPRTPEEQELRLADPAAATFLAVDGETPVGYLRIGPASDDAATIIRDRQTASITGAFIVPARRERGIGSALLQAALSWARAGGYVRVAVDHETANREATRFWRRQFRYVTLTLARRV